MTSKKFKLNIRDIAYGFVVAVFGAMVTALDHLLLKGEGFHFDKATFTTILNIGITAGVAYLLKNFFSNSHGEFGKKELGPGGSTNPPTGTDGLPPKP